MSSNRAVVKSILSRKLSGTFLIRTTMSNDGTNFKPWKIRKGVFKSTGTSDYTVPPRKTPSPIIEMPLSPPPVTPKSPTSPLSPLSPRVTIIENPLSSQIVQSTTPSIHLTIREIPIEREVSEKLFMSRLSRSRTHKPFKNKVKE